MDASGDPEAFPFPGGLLGLGGEWLDTGFASMLGVVRSGQRCERGTRGRVRIGLLLFVLLAAVAGYLGIQAASAYVNYLSLSDTVRLVVRDVAMNPQRLEEGTERILKQARELQIPLSEEQVSVMVNGEKVLATARWQEPIGAYGFTFPLSFEIEEQRSLR